MSYENDLSVVFYPNGQLNVPYVLANANLLLKAKEWQAAESLFVRVREDAKYGHCGHYGVGKCKLALGDAPGAARAFEKAFELSRRSFIAVAWVEALVAAAELVAAESRAKEFAREFAGDAGAVEALRGIYRECVVLTSC